MAILVLQHVTYEPAGIFLPALAARGGVTACLVADGLPESPRPFAALVVMGGPMGVYETDRYRWLADETAFVAQAVDAGVPVLGVCLGSQLLAAALGASVGPGPVPEIGVAQVELTRAAADDPVFGGLGNTLWALQWHGDTFTLPAQATLLASSPAYAHQAFCVGSAYGLQFHLEVDGDLAADWLAVPAYRQALLDIVGPDGPERLVADLADRQTAISAAADHVITRWLDAFVDPG